MRKIYKYELPVDGSIIAIKQYIIKILNIQEQNGIPVMWAIVDPDDEVVEPLKIIAIGTGWELPTGLEDYLGTAQDEYGFIWHYFTIKLEDLREKPEEKTFAALAQSLGKVGATAEEVSKAFNMSGLFDACM